MRTRPLVHGSRLQSGWCVLKPEPHRGIIRAETWREAVDKALDWCAREKRRQEREAARLEREEKP